MNALQNSKKTRATHVVALALYFYQNVSIFKLAILHKCLDCFVAGKS